MPERIEVVLDRPPDTIRYPNPEEGPGLRFDTTPVPKPGIRVFYGRNHRK